jgi:hypothetical protein
VVVPVVLAWVVAMGGRGANQYGWNDAVGSRRLNQQVRGSDHDPRNESEYART